MPPAKHSVFRRSAVLSGLVTREQLAEAEAELLQQANAPTGAAVQVDDDALADQLIIQGLLTPYQVGQLMAGRTKLTLGPYIITDWIGQGGMGQVFKAFHQYLGRQCAVKVLPLSKATPETVANFQREIRMQAQLDHPNLVRAYDAGRDGNVHYLVTEYVPGTDLRRLIRTQGPLSMQQAASVMMQAARGLEYAHRRGLIHRDVKPGNILVTPKGIAKVSDLGLSGFIHRPDEDPRAGKIVGTADYLAPEQIKTPQDITPVSDIYALGCTLYYAVTGKVPFPGGTKASKARRHCEETPWHPRRFNPELSEEFVEIVADMMEKEPDSRIQSAGEVAARLEPWATDAIPLQPQQLTKSPWMPPPLPVSAEELPDTDATGLREPWNADHESGSQASQTDALASATQETTPIPGRPHHAPSPLDPVELRGSGSAVALALAIAIPASLLAGSLITLGVLWILR